MDISILKDKPSLTESITMVIRPLAPLSMVAEMPGSFYKTLKVPNKKMLCGAIENIIGWHFSYVDRKRIASEYSKLRKKEHCEVTKVDSGSSYIPLLMDYFKISERIELKNVKNVCFYKDLWNRCYRRADSFMHVNGCRNIGFDVIKEFHKVSKKDVNKENKKHWFDNNIGSIPYFYTKPTDREYIFIDGYYIIPMLMDQRLLTMLKENIVNNNMGYLGNSEGWINIKIDG